MKWRETWWTKRKEADLRPYEGARKGVWNDTLLGDEVEGSDLGPPISERERGFWNDMRGPAWWTKWKEADLRTCEP